MKNERKISAVIIAQDEQERISAAIESCIGFADEILVVDGGSKDKTADIAKSLGCRVVVNTWSGYASQRNFGADNAAHRWVFMLDADEVVSKELADSFSSWKAAASASYEAYSVYRVGDFFDSWLYGEATWYTRFYDKTKHRVANRIVHEGIDVEHDQLGKLDGILWHYGFRGLADTVNRFNKYTSLEVPKAVEEGKNFRLSRMVLKPPAKFLQKYIFQGLYRLGIKGLIVSMLWLVYTFLTESKLYEIEYYAKKQKTG